MLRYLLLLPGILGAFFSYSQTRTGSIVGQTTAADDRVDGVIARSGVAGVVVEAYTPRDTLYSMTSSNGYFQLKKVTAGRVVLRLSHLSYKEVIREVEVKPGETTEFDEVLQEARQEIESVTVKGEVPVLTVKGDTLVYHAAAVRTFEGDETMKIVEQLPGVEASESGVRVMGQQVVRAYVDGKRIFGNDPMAALQNLLANDVVKIRVYDEYEEKHPKRKRRQGEEMQRVLDIETKSKLIQSTTGHFLASYGADMDLGSQGRDRYGIGATANFFSEGLLLSANAFFNNINRKSNRIADIMAIKSPKTSYDRTTYADVGAERNWYKGKSPITLGGSYSYSDDYTCSENWTRQDYFPASDYASRSYADTSRRSSTERLHTVGLRFGHPDLLRGPLSFDHRMQFKDGRSESYRSYASEVDGGTPVGGQTRSFDKRSQYDISDRISWSPFEVDINVNFDMSNDDGRGFRTDTLTSTATRRELLSTSDGLSRKVQAGISKNILLSEEKFDYLQFGYTYTWEKSRRKKMSLDLADAGGAVIDRTNTYDFTNDYNTHKAQVMLGLAFPKIKANLKIQTDFSSSGINRDERFPDDDRYDRRFNAFLPSISFLRQNMMNHFMLFYATAVRLPSVEQLRPRLDDTNPYMLVAGNRNLAQSYLHMLQGRYTTMFGKANDNLVFELEVRRTDDVIADKRIFFSEATYLPAWDYMAPAQSTLTTYENVDGMWTAHVDIKWVHPLRKLKSVLTIGTNFNYDDTPFFVDDALNRTRSYAPELTLSLRANVLRAFRFTVGTRTSYIYSKNDVGQDDKYFQQGASANAELINIFKRFYLNAAYSISYYKRFGGSSYDLNNQILNVSVGCKILKRRGDISFAAYDILNRNSGYRTAMYSNYIQETWTRSFGRYFTLNVAYKFNRSKSGVTRSDIVDGRVKEGW